MIVVEKFYSPKEVANILGCGVKTIYGYISSGRLSALNIGTGKKRSSWRIAGSELMRFVDANMWEE